MRLAVILALTLASPAAAQTIGSVAAVAPLVEGTPPGAPTAPLALADPLVVDEAIRASAEGGAQFVFADQTSLTVAPGSDFVLDSFVYDPERGVADMGVTMTKGVMRFIGGRITKAAEARIATQTGTIGIRGGLALIRVAEGRTLLVHLAGERSCLGAGADRVCTSRSGGMLAAGPGAPEYLGPIGTADLAELLALLDLGPGARRAVVVPPQALLDLAAEDSDASWRDAFSTTGREIERNRPVTEPRDLIREEGQDPALSGFCLTCQ